MASIALGLSSLIGAGGSLLAGQTQANAANNAAGLQYNLGEQGLNFEKQQYQTGQNNLAPWIQQGQSAVSQLGQLQQQGANGTGPLAPWTGTFQAPTAAQAASTPGYQFALGQGENAIQDSAAARGGLVSGNAATSLNNYAQGAADTNYQQVYNNAMQQYQLGYNQYQTNQSNLFNRYESLAGLGQTATAQAGQQGNQLAGAAANTLSNTGAQVGQQYNNAGAATASGYVGATNALGGGVNNLGQYYMLQQLMAGNGGGGGATSYSSPYGTSAPGAINPGFYNGATLGPNLPTPNTTIPTPPELQ